MKAESARKKTYCEVSNKLIIHSLAKEPKLRWLSVSR